MSALSAEQPPPAASIVVVGSINVDTILRVKRLPVPGETISAQSSMERHGGKGANQAVYAAALLAGVAMVGCVGDDERGARAIASLAHAGVDHSHVRARRAPTGTATVIVDDAGENTIVHALGANSLLGRDEVIDAVRALAGPGTIVVSSLEIPVPAVEAAAEAAGQVGARFILNPAPGRRLDSALLGRCEVLVPNAVEMDQVIESGSPEAIFATGCESLVVTRGAQGAEIFRRAGDAARAAAADHGELTSVTVPAPAVKVVDTTGAGDAFVGALVVALHDGLSLEQAVQMAVVAGAISTTAAGARGVLATRSRIAEMTAAG